MNFDEAIQAHTNWKVRLENYARGALPEAVDIGALKRDNACALGKWLHGDGRTHAADPKYGELIELHAAFHQCAGKMAEMVARGQGVEAGALINSRESEFGKLSLRVIGILMGFRSRYRDD